MRCEDFDDIDALEPVDFSEECAEEAGIAEAIRQVKRSAVLMRVAVLVIAAAVGFGVLARPATLHAIGVVALDVR